MASIKIYVENSLDGFIKSNDNKGDSADINDELPAEFNEINSGSEETETTGEDAYDELIVEDLFDKFKVDYKRQYAGAQ